MAKSALKTRRTERSVAAFLATIEDEDRRRDCRAVLAIMKKITRAEPKMWGSSIVGFGTYHYVYASGQEGDWPITAFSPRKQALTIYIMPGFDRYPALMKKLGKFKTGKSCLYLKSLADVDLPTLKALIKESVAYMKRRYK
ncbi:MAG TPA: DUF1801 domain-containing protein [Candidatus Eisenbacteria bacterium]